MLRVAPDHDYDRIPKYTLSAIHAHVVVSALQKHTESHPAALTA